MKNLANKLHSQFPNHPSFTELLQFLFQAIRDRRNGHEGFYPVGMNMDECKAINNDIIANFWYYEMEPLTLDIVKGSDQTTVLYDIILTEKQQEDIVREEYNRTFMRTRKVSDKFWKNITSKIK